ncbi:MAG: hypothetical protein J6Q54_02375 [Oscillospiraceae bacterium]|nr:hypothetical protein [Oscillospiraceae bacterium]
MKRTLQKKVKQPRIIPFPNAATPQEMLHKFLDKLLVASMGAGISASIFFLVIFGY